MKKRISYLLVTVMVLTILSICSITALAEEPAASTLDALLASITDNDLTEIEVKGETHKWWTNPDYTGVGPITFSYTGRETGNTIYILCNQGATINDLIEKSGLTEEQAIGSWQSEDFAQLDMDGASITYVYMGLRRQAPDTSLLFDNWAGNADLYESDMTVNGVNFMDIAAVIDAVGTPSHIEFAENSDLIRYYWVYGETNEILVCMTTQKNGVKFGISHKDRNPRAAIWQFT